MPTPIKKKYQGSQKGKCIVSLFIHIGSPFLGMIDDEVDRNILLKQCSRCFRTL